MKRKRTEEIPANLEEGECSNSSSEYVDETGSQQDDNEELSGRVHNKVFLLLVKNSCLSFF